MDLLDSALHRCVPVVEAVEHSVFQFPGNAATDKNVTDKSRRGLEPECNCIRFNLWQSAASVSVKISMKRS